MTDFELMALVYRVYVGTLVALCLWAIVNWRDMASAWSNLLSLEPKRRTAVAMLANWIINTAFVIVAGVHDPWYWFIAVDALSARVVLHHPAGKPQAIIGALYMVQIVVHVIYYASNRALAEPRYWQVLIALAFVQLFVLGGWLIVHHGGRLVRRLWLGGDTSPTLATSDGRVGR